MIFNISNRTLRVGLSFFIILLLFSGCKSAFFREYTFKNYKGEKNREKKAVLKQKGYRFWLIKNGAMSQSGRSHSERFDELHLTPGDYMIGYIQFHPRSGGAAYCRLKAGNFYSFKEIGRQYLSKSGVWANKGRCFFDPKRKENVKKTG